jgi:hypothetical protein
MFYRKEYSMDALAQVSTSVTLIPAYGRKYKNKEAAVVDWKAGKDFKIINGPYCSIRDLKHLSASSVWIDLITERVRVE